MEPLTVGLVYHSTLSYKNQSHQQIQHKYSPIPSREEVRKNMEYPTIFLGLLLALALYHGLTYLSRRTKKLPPGPNPLPIIGSLHLLGDQPHRSLARLSKKYGPIMSLKLGRQTTVVISSPAVAKEVLQKQDLAFSSRSVPNALHAQNHFQYSVIFLPVASRWRGLRKIMTSHIFSSNSLGANKQLRCKKIQELIAYCRKSCQNGEAVDLGRAAFRTSLNLMSNTIFSKDLTDPYSDSGEEFKDLVWNIMVEMGKPNLVDFFPVLENIDPQGRRRRMTAYLERILKLFAAIIREKLEEKTSQGEQGDFLDVLLATSKEDPEEFCKTQIEHLLFHFLLGTLQDLFLAGTETTQIALEWAMMEMLKNPDKMRKTQAELAEVIGKGKAIDEDDLVRLPYLGSVVKETLRIHPPVPLLVPRIVKQDVEVCGYKVPCGSQVLVNVWAIGRDETVWEDPLVFKPERFLESEIDVHGRDFDLIPFGAGRRICPGLPLAIRTVPMMLGSLLNSFDWKIEGGIAPKDLDREEKFGLTLRKANPMRAVPRPL